MTSHIFEGQLGIEDMARHIPHEVTLPQGGGTLRVVFSHRPEHPGAGEVPHQLSISVYGPEGARGTRHCNPDQSPVISESYASPGYLPGPIEPGLWRVEIDTHRILPPGGITYRLEIRWEAEETSGPPAPTPGATADRGPGWYLGDLHGHSLHSDADWSVADYVADARARGLDFTTLTDHNTVSGLPEAFALAGDDLLVLGGIELTTFHGHCLALGAERWTDWRIREGQTMAERAREIEAAGHLFVIAHPMALGHPWCTGCNWAYADTFPGPARVVEIWNHDWAPHDINELGLKLYQSWLNAGYRMVATAGSDTHGPLGSAVIGYTCVHAEALTQAAIHKGIRAGHVYLTAGPELRLSAGTARMGDLLTSEDAVLHTRWTHAPEGATLSLVGGSRGAESVEVLANHQIGAQGSFHVPVTRPTGGWVMAILRAPDGTMAALTNPIFFPGDWR